MEGWWFGVGLGAGLGLLYSVASWVTARFAARRQSREQFMALFVGGMLVRMALALVVIALILLFARVPAGAFVGGFLVVLVAGMALEVAAAHQGVWTSGEE